MWFKINSNIYSCCSYHKSNFASSQINVLKLTNSAILSSSRNTFYLTVHVVFSFYQLSWWFVLFTINAKKSTNILFKSRMTTTKLFSYRYTILHEKLYQLNNCSLVQSRLKSLSYLCKLRL